MPALIRVNVTISVRIGRVLELNAMLILTEKGVLRPISGLSNRLFAGCLQVKFRFGEHCNAIFKPENNPQTLPDSCLPNASKVHIYLHLDSLDLSKFRTAW
jgi:hypothetical protein